MSSNTSSLFNASSFQVVKDAMLQSEELPLVEVIDEQTWQAALERHGVNFGNDGNAINTPIVTLGALLSQVFYKDEQRSCKAAVMRIASLWAMLGKTICNTNTGAYCRAQRKISFEAVRDIVRQVALETELAFEKQSKTDNHTDEQDGDREPKCINKAAPAIGMAGATCQFKSIFNLLLKSR